MIGIEKSEYTMKEDSEMKIKLVRVGAVSYTHLDPNHGTADVYIDDKLVETIDTHGSSRKLQQRIFESDTLTDGEPVSYTHLVRTCLSIRLYP